MKFKIEVKMYSDVEVEAKTKEEAIEKAKELAVEVPMIERVFVNGSMYSED